MFFRFLLLCLFVQLIEYALGGEMKCLTIDKYSQLDYLNDKSNLLLAYLYKLDNLDWMLVVRNGDTNSNLNVTLNFTGTYASLQDIRLFTSIRANTPDTFYVATRKSPEEILVDEFQIIRNRLRKTRQRTTMVAQTTTLLDLADSLHDGIYDTTTCNTMLSAAAIPLAECCQHKKDEYCIYDAGIQANSRILTKWDEAPVFVMHCNFFYDTEFYGDFYTRTYLSHMYKGVDYNEVRCFETHNQNFAQLQIVDTTWKSKGDNLVCLDLNAKYFKTTPRPSTQKPVTPPRRVVPLNFTGVYDTKFYSIYDCLKDYRFYTAAGVDAFLALLILMVIVLAQLGVRVKNRGRKRTKWYKRRPRWRRRHRRHRHAETEATDATTYSQYSVAPSTYSQMPTTSVVPSGYTQRPTSVVPSGYTQRPTSVAPSGYTKRPTSVAPSGYTKRPTSVAPSGYNENATGYIPQTSVIQESAVPATAFPKMSKL